MQSNLKVWDKGFVILFVVVAIWPNHTQWCCIDNAGSHGFLVLSSLGILYIIVAFLHELCFDKHFQGLIHDVFTLILRGLSGAKVTRPGKFRSCQDGYAVKASLKAEDGVLYPLEKCFFFLPRPPTLILHEEVLMMQKT